MEKIIMYKCSFCGKVYKDDRDCMRHEDTQCTKNNRWHKINEKWQNGYTLGAINDEYHIIKILPPELRNATKETVIRCEDVYNAPIIEGTIHKFVSSHVVIVSCNSAWERKYHRGYTDFKYMQCIL